MAEVKAASPIAARIAATSFFGEFGGASMVRAIENAMREVSIDEGTVIWEADDPVEWVYFVREGRVVITGAGKPDNILEPPAFIGGLDLSYNGVHRRRATALDHLTTMRLSAEHWTEIVMVEASSSVDRLSRTADGLLRAVSEVGTALIPAITAPALGRRMGRERILREHAQLEDHTLRRTLVLRASPLLTRARTQTLLILSQVIERREVSAGDIIVPQGKTGGLAIVARGEVRLTHEVGPALVQKLGDSIGGTAGLAESPWPYVATALTDSVIYDIDKTKLYDVAEDHVDLFESIMAAQLGGLQWLSDLGGLKLLRKDDSIAPPQMAEAPNLKRPKVTTKESAGDVT